MDCRTPGFPVLHCLTKSVQIHVHWVSDAIQPSHPLSFPSPPALNLSQHQGLFWVSSSHHMAKILELPLQHQSFQSILSWFPLEWIDLILHAIQGTLKSLLQPHNLKATILQLSAFFMVQLSHPYMTTVETIALNIQTFVSNVFTVWKGKNILYARRDTEQHCSSLKITLLLWLIRGHGLGWRAKGSLKAKTFFHLDRTVTQWKKAKELLAQLYPTLCDPMDYSPPGSSVHRISQARILEWVAISSSRDWTQVPCIQADSLPSEPPCSFHLGVSINDILLLPGNTTIICSKRKGRSLKGEEGL